MVKKGKRQVVRSITASEAYWTNDEKREKTSNKPVYEGINNKRRTFT